MARRSKTEDTPVVVALGSILGNIGQAMRNQELTAQADALATQREHLLAVVRQWHHACQRERMTNAELRRTVRDLEHRLEEARTTADRLRDESARLHAAAAEAATTPATAKN